jgi:hypothetical protein
VGLFDRIETGLSLQTFGDEANGGNVWGAFGQVRLWEPIDQGIGVATGARWLSSPDFGDGVDYSPGRLGFADHRLVESYTGQTGLSFYGVATAYLRGFDGGFLPPNDMTFSLGWGSGMFRGGGDLDFYAPGHANGWFYGASVHLGLGEAKLLALMAEHNGYDVNIGAQLDWAGLRVGAHYLASNHPEPAGGYASEYQKPKFGFLASVAVCPAERGFRCRPHLMRRTEPDTVFIPPPPADTVVVEVGLEPQPPEGEEITLCLSTGRGVSVTVTAQGDTLVGPRGVPRCLLVRARGPDRLRGPCVRKGARCVPGRLRADPAGWGLRRGTGLLGPRGGATARGPVHSGAAGDLAALRAGIALAGFQAQWPFGPSPFPLPRPWSRATCSMTRLLALSTAFTAALGRSSSASHGAAPSSLRRFPSQVPLIRVTTTHPSKARTALMPTTSSSKPFGSGVPVEARVADSVACEAALITPCSVSMQGMEPS